MKEWIFDEAIKLLHQGDNAKAAQLLAKYIKRYPYDVNAWLMLTDALEDRKKIEFALNKVFEIEPENEIALEKYKRLINDKEKKTFYDSPFIDLNSEINPTQSESFVYIPEYENNQFTAQTDTQRTLSTIQAETKAIIKTKNEEEKEQTKQETTPNKILGIFFIGLLMASAIVAIYITKSLWVPQISPFFQKPAQIYFEAFQENKNPILLPSEFSRASTEVAIYMNPTPTPIIKPTPIPTLSTNEIEAYQIVNQVNQIKLQSETPNKLFIQSTLEEMNALFNVNQISPLEIEAKQKVLIAFGLIEPYFDFTAYINNDKLAPEALYNQSDQNIYIQGATFSPQTKADYSFAYTKWLQSFGLMKQPLSTENTYDQQMAQTAFFDGDARFTQQLFEETLSTAEKNQIKNIDFTYTNWTIPPALFANQNFAFQYGTKFIESIYQQSQMIGVQSLYSNIPKTTEQIMHVEKYFAHELGTSIPMPEIKNELGSQWNLVENNSLGEWGTFQILHNSAKGVARIDEMFAHNAAAGWGGDSYQVYSNTDTLDYLLVAHWIMDTTTDAIELTNNLSQVSKSRFSRGIEVINENSCSTQGNMISCVFNTDRQILWIIAPEKDLISSILSRYPAIK